MVCVLSPTELMGPRSVNLARPKSKILTNPESVTMTFAGLRSRWMMPAACAMLSASVI